MCVCKYIIYTYKSEKSGIYNKANDIYKREQENCMVVKHQFQYGAKRECMK